jgi:hypothetical protein
VEVWCLNKKVEQPVSGCVTLRATLDAVKVMGKVAPATPHPLGLFWNAVVYDPKVEVKSTIS